MFRQLRTLLPYFRKHAAAYAAGILCLAVTSGSQILIPQFLKKAVDEIATGKLDMTVIGTLMLQMIGVAFVIAVGRLGWRFFIHGSSRRIEAELREQLFRKFVSLQPGYFHKSQIGDLMARSTNDMNAIRMATGMALVALFDGLFMTIAILSILFTQQPRLSAIAIIPLPFILTVTLFLGRFVRGMFLKVQQGFAELSQQTQEIFSGVRVVKSFVKEPFFMAKFREANDRYQSRNMNLVRIWGFFFPVVGFLAGIMSLTLLRYGGAAVISGTLSAGDFVATLSYLDMLVWPMLGAGWTVNMLQRGAASMERVNEVLHQVPTIQSPTEGVREVQTTDISIRHLTFAYDDAEEPVLHDVSIEIPEGTILGILGRTGAGKSTLLTLLPRLENPPRGTVFVGGVDVLDYDLGVLRSAFGSVPQDTFLFSASLHDNIGFAVDDADESLIRHAADVSTITRDVETFPDGWNTEVGERGITLSGGQKQRVAISRALAKDPRILIFDDALSAVDTETEEKILAKLLAENAGRTGIVVSHRVSTLASADRIAVLDDGRLVQYGTHAELLSQEGFYQEVALLQQLSGHSRTGGDRVDG